MPLYSNNRIAVIIPRKNERPSYWIIHESFCIISHRDMLHIKFFFLGDVMPWQGIANRSLSRPLPQFLRSFLFSAIIHLLCFVYRGVIHPCTEITISRFYFYCITIARISPGFGRKSSFLAYLYKKMKNYSKLSWCMKDWPLLLFSDYRY